MNARTINPEDPKWTAYVLGELDAAQSLEIDRLLEVSEEARALVEELRLAAVFLKDELAIPDAVVLKPDQRERVHAAAAAVPARRTARTPTRWGVGLVAASLLGGVIVLPLAYLQEESGRMTALVLDSEQDRSYASAAGREGRPASGGPVRETADTASSNGQSNGTSVRDQSERETQVPLVERLSLSEAGAPPEAQADPANAANAESAAAVDASSRKQEIPIVGQDVLELVRSMPAAGRGGGPGSPAANTVVGGLEYRSATVVSGLTSRGPTVINPDMVGQITMGLAAAAAPPPPFPPPPPPAPGVRADTRGLPRNAESYDSITDNPFVRASQEPLATFSIDVDTASYSNVRRFLNQSQMPPRDSVRIEELINYFSYEYAQPSGTAPIAPNLEVAAAPWNPQNRLVRIGIKAREIDSRRRPASNLVFLIDVSGSMNSPQKLPLVKSSLKLLIDNLTENDTVSMVTYAGNSGLALPQTSGSRKDVIQRAIDNLEAGGSTNGGAGIEQAYAQAVAGFIRNGTNRVILVTDGDFNVGVTNPSSLTRLIEDRAKSGVFLSVLGFGMGNLKDSTMEKLADQGNGHYAYIDSLAEARKVLVEEMGSTLVTVAKDVKIQVDFNPGQVEAYRLIGYENRVLAAADFNNDLKDAGDMGAGHTVTALFEVVPRGGSVPGSVEPSKYAAAAAPEPRDNRAGSNEMLTLRVRYKLPDAAQSTRMDVPLVDRGAQFNRASQDFRFAAAVAGFGMLLRESPYRGNASFESVLDLAEAAKGSDRAGYRGEFISLVSKAKSLVDRMPADSPAAPGRFQQR